MGERGDSKIIKTKEEQKLLMILFTRNTQNPEDEATLCGKQTAITGSI